MMHYHCEGNGILRCTRPYDRQSCTDSVASIIDGRRLSAPIEGLESLKPEVSETLLSVFLQPGQYSIVNAVIIPVTAMNIVFMNQFYYFVSDILTQ